MYNAFGYFGHVILRVQTRVKQPDADYLGDIRGDFRQAEDGGLKACDMECFGGEGWGWGCLVAVQRGNGGWHFCCAESRGLYTHFSLLVH